MSLIGQQQLELESQRREQMRLEQSRGQARSLASTCRQQVTEVSEADVQQLAGPAIKKAVAKLDKLEANISASPEDALRDIGRVQTELQGAIVGARTKARQWSQQQAKARQCLDEARAHVQAAKTSVHASMRHEIAALDQRLLTAEKQMDRTQFDGAIASCAEAEAAAQRCLKADLKERERREIVKGLLSTLQSMGFVIDGPTASGQPEEQTVTLLGRLPSGRRARFEITLNGQLSYDLDGYEGQSCVKEMDRLEATMRDRFSVRFGEREATLKNPIRIAKGARNQPSSRTGKA